jgi:alpha-beta hydrolase superfamily lysophospholipase
MLWGEDDAIVTREGHEQMCAHSKNATFKTYPGGRHNLLMEPAFKMQVIVDIRDWILATCKSHVATEKSQQFETRRLIGAVHQCAA